MTPRLAIFDIDGTLTDTNAVDDECFLLAAADAFELDAGGLDWTGAPHVTDSTIARWMSEHHRGRAATSAELDGLVRRFLALLEEQLARSPARFAPIAGAVGLLPSLRAAGWDVALATGGWGRSARFKLTAAGIHEPELVLACADDGLTREEIVLLARDRAAAEHRRESYTRIVSVGDGVWDVRTAANLGIPFVGVGAGERAARLREAGASVVLSTFADREAVCTALASAPIPSRVD